MMMRDFEQGTWVRVLGIVFGITALMTLGACVPKTGVSGRDGGNQAARGSKADQLDDLDSARAGARESNPADEGSDSSTPTDIPTSLTYKEFTGPLSQDKILEWVKADQARRGSDAANYRYAYIPEEFLRDPKEANYARIGLSKAINSVAVDADDIVSPEDASDGYGVVFALPIRAYWGDRAEQKWNITARAVPKQVFSPAPRLDLRAFDANAPVSADRLAYNMLHGGIYNQLIDTPSRGQNLIRQIGAREVTARSAVKNAITFSPRYIQRRQLEGRPGAYWESFDDFNGNRRDLVWLSGNPIPRFRNDGMVADFGTVASEAWYHMKNGLPAYFIWGNANQERTKAEQSFVIDPLNNKSRDLLTGACIFCHISGVQTAPSDMWNAIEQGLVTRDVERARQFWTSNEELSKQYVEDRRLFVEAMRKIVVGISGGDAEFNEAIINGSDEREPAFFLTSGVTKNPLRGDTTGRRRRDENGRLPSIRR